VAEEQRLLTIHIDMEIWIRLVEVMKRHARDAARGGGEVAVNPRFLQRGMGEEDKDAGSHAPQRYGEARPGQAARAT
jgi:hypothetical protein